MALMPGEEDYPQESKKKKTRRCLARPAARHVMLLGTAEDQSANGCARSFAVDVSPPDARSVISRWAMLRKTLVLDS